MLLTQQPRVSAPKEMREVERALDKSEADNSPDFKTTVFVALDQDLQPRPLIAGILTFFIPPNASSHSYNEASV